MTSSARTIYVVPPPPGGVGPGGSINGNVQLIWPPKQPGDGFDFTVDLSVFLEDAGGDTINPTTVSITCTPSDLTYSAPTITSTAITWIFNGGTITSPVTYYQIMLSLVTMAGLAVTRQLFMPIAPSTPLPGAGGLVWIVAGEEGEAGGYTSIQGGSVTTLAAGASVTASFRTPSPGLALLDIGVPQGPPGVPGTGGTAFTPGANLTLAAGVLSVTRVGFPVNLHGFVQSLPAVGFPQILVTIDVGIGEGAIFPANLVGSINTSNIVCAAAYIVSITKNGITVATLTFPAGGGANATMSSAGFSTLPGDTLQWVGQNTPDATGSGFRFNLYGTVH